jgi:hypothetical protein
MPARGIVTLLTDFGVDDAYVGAMKGAMLSVNRDLTIVDITHRVPPQDVHEAAWLLRSAYRYFPPATVHVVVVDPGVGTERRAITASAGGWYFVGPDNGVFTWPLRREPSPEVVQIERRDLMLPSVSDTFHGRDVFAPIAAHLASGTALRELGTAISDAVMLPIAPVQVTDDAIVAAIVHIDRFGNAVTSLEEDACRAWLERTDGDVRVRVSGHVIEGVSRTYADVASGEALALFESSGCLEIAVRNSSAAEALGLKRGDEVRVERV